MEIEKLSKLGLTKGEVNVYSAILNIGNSRINTIHEKTGLERRAIYDIINKLIEKGLISYTIEKGKKTYQLTSPKQLKEKVERKIEELKEFEELIPKIYEIYKSKKPKINFEILRGKEGIKSIFEDMLNYKEIYAIGGGFYIIKELPYYWPNYNKRRLKEKSTWYNLVRSELKDKTPKDKLINIKFLPKEFSGNPSVIIIYGDKVSTLSWGEELFAFTIESKDVSENYKRYHKFLWDKVAKYR